MSHHPAFPAHVRRAKPISLTALIDVVFILLMFFMLTSSFTQWQMLELKTPSVHEESTQDVPPIILVYEDKLALLTDVITKPITLKQIQAELSKVGLLQSVVVSAEESVTVNRLIQHYEQLKTLGFTNIQIGSAVSNQAQAITK